MVTPPPNNNQHQAWSENDHRLAKVRSLIQQLKPGVRMITD